MNSKKTNTTDNHNSHTDSESHSHSDFEASVGMSRKWNAREAGREVAENTLKNLKHDPNFFLLFSTIHYEKNGGFQEFLDGVWDILPEGTPLVGGTVAGFINPKGCYTRGASAIAVSYPNMDVAMGIGRKTKRKPRRAAIECAEMIRDKLDNSQYNTGFVFSLVSGGLVPQIPGMGRKRIYKGLLGNFAARLYPLFSLLQKGSGKEDEIWKSFVEGLGDYKIINGSTMDDMNMLLNYQFSNKEILTNSIVALGMKIDLDCDTNTTHGMKKTNINFNITKISRDKRLIRKINNKPATSEMIKILGWPEEYLNETIYNRVFYYPLGFEKGNVLAPEIIGSFVGESILVSWQIPDSEIKLLTISGKELINTVEENLNIYREKNKKFGLICSCGVRLGTLGNNVYNVKQKISDFFGESPFLLIYVGGESTYSKKRGLVFGNDTFNTAVFYN